MLAALSGAAAQAPSARALSPDGERWLSRQDLLDAADTLPAQAPVRDVPAGSAFATVTALLAAQRDGALPVVRDEAWSAATVDAVLASARQSRQTGQAGQFQAGPPARLAVLTSGSSAAPRVVVRTVASWADSFAPFSTLTGIGAQDVVWAPGGAWSTLTLFAVWHGLACGVPVVAGGRWRGVAAAGPTATEAGVVHCVPAVLADLVAARAAGLLPRLRRAVVAGAAITPSLRRNAAGAGIDVVEYYGAAELSFVAADADGTGLRAFPGAEVEVRDGVIWVRSGYVSAGYLDPGTGGALRGDGDGWWTVGDRGVLAADGMLSVHGRGGDVISVGGQVVPAADVERVLGSVEGVAEVVCVGEPHARLGERVVVAVRPVEGADPLPAMRAAARRGLAAAARPVRYVVVAELPRTAGGKVARRVLRAQVTRAGAPAEPAEPG